ncbi:acyl carrier protein [Flavobacterium sp. MFBS3-15]|uniref:acyl carrier protein n=1 Tax=Flavobacterium sp. MFBS3-15 TaxID=2989816 RepID=UPI002235B092|nr:acyl carrier protein [Flavobacterium sp. MFBS3-15]MCW4469580.1 acyl carrier protein [Flavobacterium sp. MFBS3-15]
MEKFLELIKEVLEIEDRELNMEDNFKDYDEWDSLARLSLIASIDDEYNVQIEEEKFRTLNTLSDLYTEIQSRVEA